MYMIHVHIVHVHVHIVHVHVHIVHIHVHVHVVHIRVHICTCKDMYYYSDMESILVDITLLL